MIGRILKIFLVLALIILIIHRLFNRHQKHVIHEVIKTSAWVLLAAASLTLICYTWMAYW